MSFKVTDQHRDEYLAHGYTVFRNLLPPALIADLRRVAAQGRALARQQHGPQAQRLQPVAAYDLDQQPFRDYLELPALRAAIDHVLSPAHATGSPMLGILYEPADLPWCTHWHRDWRDNIPGLRVETWLAHFDDLKYFNQVNCALYADSCTWVVPGSHLRRTDLPAEQARFPTRPIAGPALDGLDACARERACLDYCASLPGAVQLHLNAGDYCLYRNTLWHLGNYLPYRQRATLHDAPMTPEFSAWVDATLKDVAERNRAA